MSGDKVICLLGPTAAGKTDLAIELAERLNCELVSVDSALVYRGLDIGSAKPDYPHHLIDLRDPSEPYSVAEFCTDAAAVIEQIIKRGRTPLLVGGTMMYFRALLQGMAEMPAATAEIRSEIEDLAAAEGWAGVHRRLAEVDPQSAARIHSNHSQRLSRALEVFMVSGVPLSEWHARQDANAGLLARFEVRQLAICPWPRELLHRRIRIRAEQMWAGGLEAEVRELRARVDLHADLPAVRAVGYRQVWQALEGEYPMQDALERVVIATRQLAKRQLTWLRGWPDLDWVYTDGADRAAMGPEELSQSAQNPLDLALKYLQSDHI